MSREYCSTPSTTYLWCRMDSSLGSKIRDTISVTSVLNGSSQHQQGQGGNEDEDLEPILRGNTEDAHASPRSSLRTLHKWLSAVKGLIVDQWFLVGLGCLILISSQVQVSQSQQEVGLEIISNDHGSHTLQRKEVVVTYFCVALIFIITGCTLPTGVLIQNYQRWKLHLLVQSQCFLMTSAVSFVVVSICATNPTFMDAGLLVGIIFTGCVPTTISSNVVMTEQAHGNQPLTVVQSTLGNFLGPFLTPLLVLMYTSTGAWYTEILPQSGASDLKELYRRTFKQLGLSLFLPMVHLHRLTSILQQG